MVSSSSLSSFSSIPAEQLLNSLRPEFYSPASHFKNNLLIPVTLHNSTLNLSGNDCQFAFYWNRSASCPIFDRILDWQISSQTAIVSHWTPARRHVYSRTAQYDYISPCPGCQLNTGLQLSEHEPCSVRFPIPLTL